MGRYSFEKKAKYRKEAVHTGGKVSKKKNATNIDLREIIQSGEVEIKNVPFNKTQHPATPPKKRCLSKVKNSEELTKPRLDAGSSPTFNGNEPNTMYKSNPSVGDVSKRYHNGNLLSDVPGGCSNGWIANALLRTDSDSSMNPASVVSVESYSSDAASPRRYYNSSLGSPSESHSSSISPEAVAIENARYDTFLDSPINVVPTTTVMADSPQAQNYCTALDLSTPHSLDVPTTRSSEPMQTSDSSSIRGVPPDPVQNRLEARKFRPIGGQPISTAIPNGGQPYSIPIGGQPFRSSIPVGVPRNTANDAEFELPNPSRYIPTMQTVASRMMEIHGPRLASRAHILPAAEQLRSSDKESLSMGSCVFASNFIESNAIVPQSQQNRPTDEDKKNEEFDLVEKNSTYEREDYVVLKTFMSKKTSINQPCRDIKKYRISFSPNVAEGELEYICRFVDKLCLEHDSQHFDIPSMDQLCQKSYEQYKVGNDSNTLKRL